MSNATGIAHVRNSARPTKATYVNFHLSADFVAEVGIDLG